LTQQGVYINVIKTECCSQGPHNEVAATCGSSFFKFSSRNDDMPIAVVAITCGEHNQAKPAVEVDDGDDDYVDKSSDDNENLIVHSRT
jgi:hypothetical protein